MGPLITIIAGAQMPLFYFIAAEGNSLWYMITKQWFVVEGQTGIYWFDVYASLMVVLTFLSLPVTAVLEIVRK